MHLCENLAPSKEITRNKRSGFSARLKKGGRSMTMRTSEERGPHKSPHINFRRPPPSEGGRGGRKGRDTTLLFGPFQKLPSSSPNIALVGRILAFPSAYFFSFSCCCCLAAIAASTWLFPIQRPANSSKASSRALSKA